jgi:N utilization substance protein B
MSSFRASPSQRNRRVAVGKRHQARELALKVLFQLEGQGGSAGGSAPRDHPREGGEAPPLSDDPEEVLRYHAIENGATDDIATFARELVRGVLDNQEKLDGLLSEASEHWRLEQMAKVDRVILRIAVYEIAIDRKVPTKAAINESIELAKTFSGDDAGRFVNGILGRVAATTT